MTTGRKSGQRIKAVAQIGVQPHDPHRRQSLEPAGLTQAEKNRDIDDNHDPHD
jgi:hypothetical protein